MVQNSIKIEIHLYILVQDKPKSFHTREMSLNTNSFQTPPAYNTRSIQRLRTTYGIQYPPLDQSWEETSLLNGLERIDEIERRDAHNQTSKSAYFATVIAINLMAAPFMTCDLYYASTNEACLWKTYNTMKISLYEYLVISSLYSISAFIAYIFNLQISLYRSQPEEWTNIERFCEFSNRTFIMIWTLVGALMFWHFIKDSCSPSLNGYMTTSLICKFIIYSIYFTYSYFNELSCGVL
jgi:hypothetical protein